MALLCRDYHIIGPNNAPNTTRIAAKTRHERDTRPAARADPPGDSLDSWFRHYQQLAVTGVRSVAVAQKIALDLDRFRAFFIESYRHERITACLCRDVQAWQHALIAQGLAAATINNHLVSLSACTTWIHARAARLSGR